MLTHLSIVCVIIPFIAGWCCNSPTNFDAKLKKITSFNDRNGDGKVTLSEIKEDLDKDYDKNNDSKVSKVEFVLGWNCYYGDELGFPEFVFSKIDRSKDGFIEISDVAQGPMGKGPMSAAAFEQRNKERYALYKTSIPIGK